MIGKYILLTSFFYLILLTIVYFSKKRFLNSENKVFKIMLIANIFGIILDVLSMIIIPMEGFDLLGLIVNKLYLVYLITWITLFTFYTYFISKYDSNYVFKRKNTFRIVFFIMVLLILILPIEFVVSEKGVYSYGLGTLFIYLYSLICMFLMVKMLLSNIKKIGKKKYIPILCFLGIGGIVIGIQAINPYLLLMTAMETFITFLMYFTIENPDLQIVSEYREIKDIAKRQNIDKVMFLHNTTQNLRYGLLDIERNAKLLYEEINNQDYRDCLEDISYNTKKMLNVLTKVHDPNLINESEIKPFNDNYDTVSFESMFKSYRGLIPKNIKYSYQIDANIPEYLYGDILNIKEILKEIVKETINNIQDGYIKIKLDVIIEDNVCRLIINIKDNGDGYHFKDIEESLKNGLFKKYNDDLSKINGSFIINSEKDIVTEKIIVIDQLIVLKEDKKLEKLDHISEKKKVMIVDNSNISDNIIKLIKKYDVEYEKVDMGVDCLNKVRNYEKFDLIIMNDKLEPLTGIETFKKLKENITFKIPVIILSEEKDFKVKEKYLQLGISDIISLPFEKELFIEIIDKYLK